MWPSGFDDCHSYRSSNGFLPALQGSGFLRYLGPRVDTLGCRPPRLRGQIQRLTLPARSKVVELPRCRRLFLRARQGSTQCRAKALA
jgi:hypothetical protein